MEASRFLEAVCTSSHNQQSLDKEPLCQLKAPGGCREAQPHSSEYLSFLLWTKLQTVPFLGPSKGWEPYSGYLMTQLTRSTTLDREQAPWPVLNLSIYLATPRLPG